MKNTVEGHSSILEQEKDRTSGLKYEIDIKKKKEVLDKRLKSCKRNMKALSNSIKRPNL
jgi:hypothetical protein